MNWVQASGTKFSVAQSFCTKVNIEHRPLVCPGDRLHPVLLGPGDS